MTHALPIPSGPRSVRLLPMQFAAPLRTAESYWLEPDEEVETSCGLARRTRVLGLARRAGAAGLILVWGGLALWQFA